MHSRIVLLGYSSVSEGHSASVCGFGDVDSILRNRPKMKRNATAPPISIGRPLAFDLSVATQVPLLYPPEIVKMGAKTLLGGECRLTSARPSGIVLKKY